MANFVSRMVRSVARPFRSLVRAEHRIDDLKANVGRILARLNRDLTSAKLQDYEFTVYSSAGEDGIIQKLISSIEIRNRTFVEFGVEDFSESNCRFLIEHDNWQGLVIDGSPRHVGAIRKSRLYWRHDLQALCRFITKDNIEGLIDQAGFDSDIGLLSVDLDGVDYFVLEAIKRYSPRIIVVEYNSVFGAERAISVPYDPDFVRTAKHHSNLYFGASLAAFDHLLGGRGYSLVGSNSFGSNAFFVRSDLLAGGLRATKVADAYVESLFRESRDPNGALTYRRGAERYREIKGLPVVNVMTGETEAL